MRNIRHTTRLPDGQTIPAVITVYQTARDATLPQHDDLYRPDRGVWAVAEIDHPSFKHRAWTITADSARDAAAELRREIDSQAAQLVRA